MTSLGKFYGVSNVVIPSGGPRTVPVTIDFSAGASVEVDGLLVTQNGAIDFIQGVYIDNSENAAELSVTCGYTKQRVICPAHSQGYFALLITNPPNVTVVTTPAANLEVSLYFYNVPIQACVWGPNSGGGGGDASAANQLTEIARLNDLVLFAEPPTLVDLSNILSGGSDTALIAGSNYFIIQNPTGNNPIKINLAGGDATVRGIVIEGGGYYESLRGASNAVTMAGTATETVIIFGN